MSPGVAGSRVSRIAAPGVSAFISHPCPFPAPSAAHGIACHVGSSRCPHFSAWRIGLTSDVPKAYEQWRCPAELVSWPALSLTDALWRTTSTREKGMRCLTGGELYSKDTERVCIFPAA